jgi:AspT/YidE/YbjL antiporter-like protein
LTSTPAFSAAKASAEGEYESAVTVGYGLAYIFGVIGVVLFVQIVPKILKVDMDIERELILDREYKITKRVGTDRTDQTERTKISRSISGDIQKTDKIIITKSEKNDTLENIEKEIKHDNKKSKFFLEVSVKNDKKGKEKPVQTRNDKKENNEFDTKSNAFNSEPTIKFSQNSEIVRDKKNENEVENYVIEEEKENEDNINEEKENEDNNNEEKENEDNNNEEKEISEDKNKPEKLFVLDKYGFCVFGFGALIGIFVGAIRIPLSKEGFKGSAFSLTTTGGVLLTCLILGHIGKIKKLSLKVDKKVLENLRELGLILFLLGSGIAGGTKFIEYFKVIYFFYGILITLIPLIIGFFFNKYVLKLCLLNNLGSLTGAMTSTPALGTLINVSKTDNIGNPYAATYPISLISVVLSAQFMVLLMK